MSKKCSSGSSVLTPPKTGPGGASSGALRFQTPFPEAGNYSLQFNINGPDESQSPALRRTRATILWGLDGNYVSRQIDVFNGTTITGFAESVDLTVLDVSTQGFSDPIEEHSYTVSVVAAPGVRPPTQQPPTLTLGSDSFFGLGPGAATQVVEIPQAAGVISVKVTAAPSAVGTVLNSYDVLVDQQGGTAETTKSYSPLIYTDWVPIGTGVTSLLLRQSAAAPEVIWAVVFGIDG